jgi:hypothetical protein
MELCYSKDAVLLEQLCEFCLGLTPYDKYSGHTPEQIRNQVFHSKSKLDDTYTKLLKSGDVGRYIVEWNGEDWIRYGEWLAAPREKRFFTQERILVQQIIDWSSLRLFAGWTDVELYNTQNQFNLLSRNGTNLKFILAIINSKLMSYYHRRVFLDVALQRFQKVLIKDAKQFPIRRIDFTTPEADRARYLEKSDTACVLGFVDHHLSGESPLAPRPSPRTDVIHDLLAFLAGRMIDLNRTKQAEMSGFLTWLTRHLRADLDQLTGKSKIQNYLGDYQKGQQPLAFEDLLDVLGKNSRKLGVDPTARAIQTALEREYTTSLGNLLPIKEQLALTDGLIDQIVYRLYGLSDDEIAIVEGRG